jgi:hypothetical protein
MKAQTLTQTAFDSNRKNFPQPPANAPEAWPLLQNGREGGRCQFEENAGYMITRRCIMSVRVSAET